MKKLLVVSVLVMAMAINVMAGQEKVPVCHNGRTIWISEKALDAHLSHGDEYGTCEDGNYCRMTQEAFADALAADAVDHDTVPLRCAIRHYKNRPVAGFNLNFDILDEEYCKEVDALPEGMYHFRIEVTTPDGYVLTDEATIQMYEREMNNRSKLLNFK